jgi:hypothetical protein
VSTHTHKPIFRSIYIKGSLLAFHLQSDQSFAPEYLGSHPPLISGLLLVAFCMPCTTNGLDNCLHTSHVSSSWLKIFHDFGTIPSYVTYPFCGDHIIINHGLVQLFFSWIFFGYFDPKELGFFFSSVIFLLKKFGGKISKFSVTQNRGKKKTPI